MGLYLKGFLEIYKRYDISFCCGEMNTDENEKEILSNRHSSLNLIYPNVMEATNAYLENNSNDASIVCFLKSDGCNVLFTGDLEDGWESLLKRHPNLTCDILKMPHHGAYFYNKKTLETTKILDKLEPKAAIISSGENTVYKHPALKTIEALNDRKIKIICTEYTKLCHSNLNDYDKKCYGNIEIVSNKSTYEINCEKENAPYLSHIVCLNTDV